MNVAGEDHNLIYVALHSGDRDEAKRRFRASSEWIFANDNAYLRPYAFLDAGIIALYDGELERAGRLVACAQRIFADTNAIPDPDDHVELDDAVARLQAGTGRAVRLYLGGGTSAFPRRGAGSHAIVIACPGAHASFAPF